MAFYSKNFSLNGNSQSLADVSPNQHRPVKWVRIENTTGNADVTVGDKNLSATVFGFTVTAGPANFRDIAPGGDGLTFFNLEDIFVRGTNTQIIHVSYVTL